MVEPIQSSGKAIVQVCRELKLTETAVQRWVQQVEIDVAGGHAPRSRYDPHQFATGARTSVAFAHAQRLPR